MKKLKKNEGITLIALVITIIVLLILAAVSLSAVFSQDGVFSRAEQATDKYGQAKARETLEILLGEAQMQKYDEGLTDEQLTEKINTIGEELPKEKPEKPNLQNVIVDGHIFEIDRSVPKIVDYIRPADGVIITASISGNNGWQKQGEGKVTVTGVIKTYSGGTITNVNAIKGEKAISDFSIDAEGRYTIGNITENTKIKIDAMDSNNKSNTKIIDVQVRVDNIVPIVNEVTAVAERYTIILNATGIDRESGIKHFNYEITPEEGILADKLKGTFTQEQTIKIKSTMERNYTISVTAVDNCDNISSVKTVEVTTIDGLTIEQAKRLVNEDTLQEYMGVKILDYNPPAKGTWRVFYYDKSGEFGKSNKLYIKRDLDDTVRSNIEIDKVTNEGRNMMKNINPKWRDYLNENSNDINSENEQAAAYLCTPSLWENYKEEGVAEFAVGSPSIEMFIKSYNSIVDEKGKKLICEVNSDNGYSVGYIDESNSLNEALNWLEINGGPYYLYGGRYTNYCYFLASPFGGINATDKTVLIVADNNCTALHAYDYNSNINIMPIVQIK